MAEGRYFQEALANFTSEAAYVGAVRHLCALGYSAEQIKENLLYPVSLERIRQVIDEYRAEQDTPEQEYVYIQDTDRFGRKSFRRVEKPADQ